jgi:hypothetical protein
MIENLSNITKGEFSEPAIIVAGSFTFETRGIFDSTFLEVDASGATIQSKHSQLGVDIAEIDAALGRELSEDDDTMIYLWGRAWFVNRVERDGTGYGRIILQRKA